MSVDQLFFILSWDGISRNQHIQKEKPKGGEIQILFIKTLSEGRGQSEPDNAQVISDLVIKMPEKTLTQSQHVNRVQQMFACNCDAGLSLTTWTNKEGKGWSSTFHVPL